MLVDIWFLKRASWWFKSVLTTALVKINKKRAVIVTLSELLQTSKIDSIDVDIIHQYEFFFYSIAQLRILREIKWANETHRANLSRRNSCSRHQRAGSCIKYGGYFCPHPRSLLLAQWRMIQVMFGNSLAVNRKRMKIIILKCLFHACARDLTRRCHHRFDYWRIILKERKRFQSESKLMMCLMLLYR